MKLQAELREARELTAVARDEENSFLEQEQLARRQMERNQREWDRVHAELEAIQHQSRDLDTVLADEIMDLKTKHAEIRRKLEDGAAEMLETVKQINKQTTATAAKNMEADQRSRLSERQLRDEAKQATQASIQNEHEIHERKRDLVAVSRKQTAMLLAANEAHASVTRASHAIEEVSPRSQRRNF
eukprot:TRINITY_DN22613_c0_g1_i3.p1 TRINITY_DN22613_c0_g1~~TRINITY_DN22613_c0_g1_i3.p1  ORF type:complete len:186 (-),score=38.84 TRINITY_DN22613_c0_g1_i3:75-632(-)